MVNKGLTLLIAVLILAVTVSAQTDWTGEYLYGEDGGETVGGSKIYIAHTLKITEKGGKLKAHLSSQGFQTSIDIFADVNSRNGALEFIFRTVGPSHFLGTFRSGDLLFELVTQDGKMVTNWRKFKPVLERNHSAGSVRFEKVRLEPSASILREYLVPDSEVLVKIPNKTVVREHHRPFVAFNERIKKLVRVERAVFVGGIEEDTIYRVESYKTAEPEKLGESFRKFRWSSDANAFPVNLGCYSGYRLVSSSKKHYFESLQIFTPKALVVITFLNRKGKTSATKNFLDSVRMKPAARECELNANADRKAGYLSPFERSKRIVKSSGKTKIRLEMATKPRPGYTMMARNNNVAGTIGVKAIFDRNGIAYVDEVTKSLPDGLVNQAEIAVLQTLFFPEVRRGTRRGLVKRIIYNFSIY